MNANQMIKNVRNYEKTIRQELNFGLQQIEAV